MAPAPQYMRALERANQVRLARAELKRKVATNEIDVADVILACPWEADSMAVAHQVQLEDLGVCAEVQRGLKSRSYNTGRFSVEKRSNMQLIWNRSRV